jgi:TonB family protein
MLWLLANLLIRSALILSAAALLCRLFSRLRPTQRHGILLAAFVLLLCWPLLAAVLPELVIPLWQQSPRVATVTVQQFAVARQATEPSPHYFVLSPVMLWAAATILALLPLLTARLRLRAFLRRAGTCKDSAWNNLLQELSAQLGLAQPPALLIHPEPLMPMASGIWRPRIILPRDSASWSSARRRVVLLHELAHISRRDLLTQSCARLVAAVWWFQPLAWGALRLLRRESERACDELVIASGIRPSDYAAELLAIAQAFTASRRVHAAGIAMARADGLEGRLHSILQPPSTQSPRSILIALSCLTALTVAASAVTPLTESQPLSPRGHTMLKHTLFAGLLASAGLTAATIGGSLYDPSGAAVPNAKALLYDPDTNTKFETTTSADGKFAFETLPAGQYILRVQSPGFATLFREFNVKPDSKIDRGLTLALGKVHETVNVAAEGTPATAQPAAASSPSKPLRVGGNVAQTNLVTKVQPVYPKSAKVAGIQGTVELEMVISKEGEPLDIRVIASPTDDLTQSALEAVRQWRYKPTLLNGNPVEVVTDVIVNYTLLK